MVLYDMFFCHSPALCRTIKPCEEPFMPEITEALIQACSVGIELKDFPNGTVLNLGLGLPGQWKKRPPAPIAVLLGRKIKPTRTHK